MKGFVWKYLKTKDEVFYRFQVDGIKRGAFTKIIDPVFKDWKEVGSGFNSKKSCETLIFTRSFLSEDEMIEWVKSKVEFPTVYNKCNAKCTTKVLVKEKNEVKDAESKSRKSTTTKKTVSSTKPR